MVLLVFWVGCGGASWTEEGAVGPTLKQVGGRGGFDKEDCQRVGYGGGPFKGVDTDGDGQLDPAELVACMRAVDPLHFDNVAERLVPEVGINPRFFPTPTDQRRVRELLAFWLSEFQHRAPTAALPAPALLDKAVASGDLHGPEVRLVIHHLRVEAGRAGVRLPVWEPVP